jgi:hypothetical protein
LVWYGCRVIDAMDIKIWIITEIVHQEINKAFFPPINFWRALIISEGENEKINRTRSGRLRTNQSK